MTAEQQNCLLKSFKSKTEYHYECHTIPHAQPADMGMKMALTASLWFQTYSSLVQAALRMHPSPLQWSPRSEVHFAAEKLAYPGLLAAEFQPLDRPVAALQPS